MYDHRAASVVIKEDNWFRQGQTVAATLVQHQNPEYLSQSRWWTKNSIVDDIINNKESHSLIAFKNVTSPTNQRTMIASFIPIVGVINSAPLLFTGKETALFT